MKNSNERTCKKCSDCNNCFPKENLSYEKFYCILYREDIKFFSDENISYPNWCEYFQECSEDEYIYRFSIYMT